MAKQVEEVRPFSFVGLDKRMSRCCRSGFRSCGDPTPADDIVYGVKSLSDQIRSFRKGGLPLGSRELGDSNYDEDDSVDIDPTVEPGMDRFEKSEMIATMVSSRMKKHYENKLSHANPD